MKQFLCILLTVGLLLSLSACGDPQMNAAEKVLRLYLADNEGVDAAYYEALTPGREDPEEPIRRVLKEQAGEYVTDSFITDYGSGTTFSSYYRRIYEKELMAQIKTLKLSMGEDGNYQFDATIYLTDPAGNRTTAFFNGTVSFDEAGKIEDISLGGTGMEALMRP